MDGDSSARVWWPERGEWGPALDVPWGETVSFGREGDLAVGGSDRGVSRVAATAAATPDGWRIEITNANGGAVHPWGLPSSAARGTVLPWPRVAVRIEGQDTAHWVIMESTRFRFPVPRHAASGGSTYRADPPLPLTPRQKEILRSFFRPQLAWPPVSGPPRQLKNVAREFGVDVSAVQNTLRRCQEKALRLGLDSSAGLTHPDYLTVLVQNGFLPPEDAEAG